MNPILFLLISVVCFLIAGRFYARFISSAMGVDPKRTTPAVEVNDGRDYVPTKTPIIFAHHFASIAGAGPTIPPCACINLWMGTCLAMDTDWRDILWGCA